MSLRHALLGLLADQPASGYELTGRFANLGRWAWHAKHNQIYQELNRLADDGLATVVEEGARGRKTYAITEEGRRQLRDWLLHPPRDPVVRNEFTLRLFLAATLSPREARALLTNYADTVDRDVQQLRARLGDAGALEPSLEFLAARFGMSLMPAIRDWAREEVARIDRAYPADRPDSDG